MMVFVLKKLEHVCIQLNSNKTEIMHINAANMAAIIVIISLQNPLNSLWNGDDLEP
jgi:hypothetical protein